MRPTHRVYLHQYRNRRPEQTNEPTLLFYDINADAPIEHEGMSYLPVLRASSGKAWNILFESVPDGATDGILIEDLGARMQLIRTKWYVEREDVSVELAYRIIRPSPITCLQILAILILLGYAVGLLIAARPPFSMTLAVASILILILAVDHWIQRADG